MSEPNTETTASYVLIQEGGTSFELYVHAHPTAQEAEQDRFSCRDDGSYRTSPVIAVPAALAALGETFYGFLDEFVLLTTQLDFPEGETPNGDDDGR